VRISKSGFPQFSFLCFLCKKDKNMILLKNSISLGSFNPNFGKTLNKTTSKGIEKVDIF
jgi:hypothetical protein